MDNCWISCQVMAHTKYITYFHSLTISRDNLSEIATVSTYYISYRNILAYSKLSFPKLFQFYALSFSKMPHGESSEMPIRWRRWKDASHSRESKKVKNPFKGKKQMHLAKDFFFSPIFESSTYLKKGKSKFSLL